MRSSCDAFATNSFRAVSSWRELHAHPVERRRELPELVVAVVDERLVEVTLGDPLGGALDPAGSGARGSPAATAAEQRARSSSASCRGEQQAPLDERHGRELIGERAGEQEDVAGEELDRDLARTRRRRASRALARVPSSTARERDRVTGDLARRAVRPVHCDPEGEVGGPKTW